MSSSKREPKCEDSGTKESVPYVIISEVGMKRSQFKAFVKTLPDQGQGKLTEVRWRNCLSYHTALTYKRALEVAKYPFIDYVKLAGPIPETDPTGPDARTLRQILDELPRCEPSGTDQPVRYLISTKAGTKFKTF